MLRRFGKTYRRCRLRPSTLRRRRNLPLRLLLRLILPLLLLHPPRRTARRLLFRRFRLLSRFRFRVSWCWFRRCLLRSLIRLGILCRITSWLVRTKCWIRRRSTRLTTLTWLLLLRLTRTWFMVRLQLLRTRLSWLVLSVRLPWLSRRDDGYGRDPPEMGPRWPVFGLFCCGWFVGCWFGG